MSRIRTTLYEALNPLNKIANSILKKLNYVQTSLILQKNTYDEASSLLDLLAGYYSNSYSELTQEQQDSVKQKIYDTIHKKLSSKPIQEEISDEDLEQRIYTYLKSNGGIMYPLEISAKKLAQAIKQK